MEIWVRTGEPARAQVFYKPRTGRSVLPGQRCPAFVPRSVQLGRTGECWFCRHANFHLRERVALEVGVCCWPKVQSE